ncbi:hypothetical protein [Fluviicola sp.]|uniref:hypothetical protein n=1 Tax=Fluviicola sp. TaxID=1917219 RepID=UPI003D27E98A
MLNSSMGELFKLPQFLSHFTEHRTADKNISVFDFIFMHYVGNDLNDNDQDKDMQLPFKKVSPPFSFQIGIIPDILVLTKEKKTVPDNYLKVIFKNNYPKNLALNVLFKPPRY